MWWRNLYSSGETPLIHASRQEHIVTVKYLLERGADPAASSELGATSLHHSAGTGLHEFGYHIGGMEKLFHPFGDVFL